MDLTHKIRMPASNPHCLMLLTAQYHYLLSANKRTLCSQDVCGSAFHHNNLNPLYSCCWRAMKQWFSSILKGIFKEFAILFASSLSIMKILERT